MMNSSLSYEFDIFYDDYYFRSSLLGAIFYILISLYTVVGNTMVCVMFYKDPYHELRTPQNVLIISLACSDLLMGVVAEPLLAASFWSSNRLVYFIHYLAAIVSGASSILNITLLSLLRFIAVKNPLGYRSTITSTRVLWSLLIMWLYIMHFAILPIVGWRDFTFLIYLYALGATMPTVITILTYWGIFRTLKQHTEAMRLETDSENSSALRNAITRERSTTKTLMVVLMLFLAFWLPFLTIDTIMVLCKQCRSNSYHTVRDVLLTVTYLGSGVNPLVYAWRMAHFRKALLKIIGYRNSSSSRVYPQTVLVREGIRTAN